MAAYGELLNVYDPYTEKIHEMFTKYFNSPFLYKIKDIDNQYSLYAVKVNAILGIEYRYIMVIVKKDENAKHTKVPLKDLEWISLQTRSLAENHEIPTHFYIPTKHSDLNRKISLISKDNNQFIYKVDGMPIKVSLLCKSHSPMEYNNSGTLISAIETYQTILTI